MAGGKENKKILAEIKRIRRSQILSSFDVVFIILVPIATLIAGYIATHPEILTRFDPSLIYSLLWLSLVAPLFIGLIGILMDSIEYRLMGWYTFFVFAIFSYLNYSLVSLYQEITGATLQISGSLVYFFLGIGSVLIGIVIGDIFFHEIFFGRLFSPRIKEVGMPKTKLKWQKTPSVVLCALLSIGLILVLVGMLVIPKP